MKTLEQYINEKRETIGKLKFDYALFERFMKDAIIDMNYDDSEVWDTLQEQVIASYGQKIWKWFVGWCESYLEVQDHTTIQDFYNAMSNIPKNRFDRVLGAGSNGIVLDLGDKVVKIFFGNHIKTCDEPFLKWCKTHESKVFPKVYKIGKNWAILEKLNMYTPKAETLMSLIDDSNIKGKSIYEWTKEKNVDTSIFNKEELWAYNWCMTCKAEMEDMKSSYIGWPGDLAIKNIGERDNGDIVFFDI